MSEEERVEIGNSGNVYRLQPSLHGQIFILARKSNAVVSYQYRARKALQHHQYLMCAWMNREDVNAYDACEDCGAALIDLPVICELFYNKLMSVRFMPGTRPTAEGVKQCLSL